MNDSMAAAGLELTADELVELEAIAPTEGQRYPEQILKTLNL